MKKQPIMSDNGQSNKVLMNSYRCIGKIIFIEKNHQYKCALARTVCKLNC